MNTFRRFLRRAASSTACGVALVALLDCGGAVTGIASSPDAGSGDGSPGTRFQVTYEGVREFHAELCAKNYPYWRPGITETFWGTEQLNLLDPFGNKIALCEPKKDDETQ